MFVHICPMGMCMDMLMCVNFLIKKDLSIFHGIDMICYFSQKIDFVGYDNIRQIEAGQHVFKRCFCFFIKTAGGFIKKEHFWFHG